jgi:hypothetical protein
MFRYEIEMDCGRGRAAKNFPRDEARSSVLTAARLDIQAADMSVRADCEERFRMFRGAAA